MLTYVTSISVAGTSYCVGMVWRPVVVNFGVASYGAPGHVPLNLQLVCVLGVGAQSTLGGGKTFCPKIYVWKLRKMPKFYTIVVQKYFSRFFFWGGGQMSPTLLSLLRLWILCATSLRPLLSLGLRFASPSHQILATPLVVNMWNFHTITTTGRHNWYSGKYLQVATDRVKRYETNGCCVSRNWRDIARHLRGAWRSHSINLWSMDSSTEYWCLLCRQFMIQPVSQVLTAALWKWNCF